MAASPDTPPTGPAAPTLPTAPAGDGAEAALGLLAPAASPGDSPRPARQLGAALREHIRLAVPLAVANLGSQLLHLVDAAMLGRFSEEALAGAGIGGGILFATAVIGVGIIMGLDTLIPQALGAGDPARARHLLRQGVRVCVLVGAPITVIAGLAPQLLTLAGVAEGAAAETEVYVLGRLPGVVPLLVFAAARSYLQAHHVTKPLVIAMVAANLLNVAANGVLIFGDAGLAAVGLPAIGMPALGALGAALSSSLVLLLSLSVAVWAVRALHASGASAAQGAADAASHGGDAARGTAPKTDWRAIRAILRLGLPVGMQLGLEVGIFMLTAVMAGRLGTQPAAAHNVAITLASFAFGAVLGIGAATSVRVGRAVGARDRRAARRAGVHGLGIGAVFTFASAVVFVAFAEPLARLLTNDAGVVTAAVPLVRIAAVFQLSDGVQAIAAGALRGAGDTRSTMWANLVGHYAIGLLCAIGLAFGLGIGAPGLWWGLCIGLTAVAVILLLRFRWLTARPIAVVA